jgi:hypothetical protein
LNGSVLFIIVLKMKIRILGAAAGLGISLAFAGYLLGWLELFSDDSRYGQLSAWGVLIFLQFIVGYWVWCSSHSFLILRPYPLVVLFFLPVVIVPAAEPYFTSLVWTLITLTTVLSLAELYYSCKWVGILWLRRRKISGHP